MATTEQNAQRKWTARFVKALAGPVDKDIMKEVYESWPQSAEDRKEAAGEFLTQSGATHVVDFLNRIQQHTGDMSDTKQGDTKGNRSETADIKCTKYFVYLTLSRFKHTSIYHCKVYASLIDAGIVTQVLRDIQNHMQCSKQVSRKTIMIILDSM